MVLSPVKYHICGYHPVCAAGSEEQLIFREQALEIRRQAEKSTYHGLQQILEAIETADRRIRANVNFDLTMELLAMTIKENIG